MPVAMNRRRVSNFTYVSPCVKYMIFLLNFLFWLFGGLLVAAGTFAFYEKWNTMGSIKLNTFSDVILNISLVLIIAGQIIFIVSFAGCIGALRENTTLLKFLPFKNIAAQIKNLFVSNLKVVQTPNYSKKYTDKSKKSKPKNNDEVIFKQLDCYDELLNIQNKYPTYTNSLKPMNDSQLNFYEKYVFIDRNQIFNLMYSTIEQANNSAWRLYRQTRLSASSKAHQIHTRRNRNEDLAERFVKDKKIVGKGLKYVEYGTRMEDFAFKKYSLVHNVHVIKCGLVIHQKQPWICASPDGLVIHNNKLIKLLEIKCPYTCKDTLLIDEENGNLRVPYLKYNKEKNTIDLKQNHNYFTQCQIQMYCTGMEECDLFVCTKADCITVTIKRDNLFLEKLVRKMEFFYFNYYLPEITKVNS
ncbi:uncharacterized protein LOC132920010 isoform X1 [Rhopalosiphum padi]|uniref:uncharacterized protein LOC132920010 isoform X1 n=1 Tax=Rhopalosiphum padi TaxID=40932 RepID=UPI00298DF284|nr:uncharacterized protein LOC132920010 isoform X1 [Rhopalosiphum padi]XP_060837985.1 uncharacterized protein LOC132920010 isoform X1 [Rhopalosiphum padi]